MPARLEYKNPARVSLAWEVAAAFLVVVPLVWLLWLGWTGGEVAFARPWAQYFSDAVILCLPLVWVGLFLAIRLEYKATSEEVLGHTSFLQAVPGAWWMFALLWPSAFLPFLFVVKRAGAPPSFAAGEILLLWAVTLLLALFWGSTLFERKEIRISAEGIRTGPLFFTEWDRLDHVAVRGQRIDLHHQVNPALPLTCVRLEHAAARERLMDALRTHQVPIDSTTAPALHATRALVGLATLAILLVGAFADARGVWPYWILLLASALGVAGTLLLERYRGLGKVTRVKPMLEPPPRTPLEMSVERACADPTPENRADVCSEFTRSEKIYVVSREPAAPMLDGQGVPMEFVSNVLTTVGSQGESLLVFTSTAEAGRRCPEGYPVAANPGMVGDIVGMMGLVGVVINAAGPWVYLSNDELS